MIPREGYIKALMSGLDGVLLPGSDSDVDPLMYGCEPHKQLGFVQPLKDATDALVLEEAERCLMPVLGICFGMQILNVVRGGTLIQDIGAQLPEAIKHEQGDPRDRRSHRVKLMEDSLLATLSAGETALVNSHHHQAIERIGDNLIATAWTSDGLIEAVEDTRRSHFVLGVQWHPEIGWENDNFSRNIFTRLVEAAKGYAAQKVAGVKALER